MNDAPRYPDLAVQLEKDNDNRYLIIARVSGVLHRAGIEQVIISDIAREICNAKKHDQALQIVRQWVDLVEI